MKAIHRLSNHYAAWKTQGVVKSIPEVTALGRRYAELPDGAAEKEALLLELCRSFHPYLTKYLTMICRGHIPIAGKRERYVNKDIRPFLLFFLPAGQRLNWITANRIVKQLHLAFKGMETEEIYDVLMSLLVLVLKEYDPTYTDKVKATVEVIEHELSTRKQFSGADVNRHLEFDCHRYLRLLGRLGFLCPVQEGKEKGVFRFVRADAWPPPGSFFEKGAVGVAYYVSKMFRYKLRGWIQHRMREIECKEGVYSLERWTRGLERGCDPLYEPRPYEHVPSLMGEFQDASGMRIVADIQHDEQTPRRQPDEYRVGAVH